MSNLFHVILYLPLLNLLVFFYNITPLHDIGIAIILLTVVIRIILFPLTLRSLKVQKGMQDLQPKIDELKRKYKGQKDIMAQELMKLYKEEKVSPFSSCLPILLQIPILWALFRVFSTGLKSQALAGIYPFIANPGVLSHISFGYFDLAKPNYILAGLAAIAQFFQSKMLPMKRPEVKGQGSKDEDMAAIMNKQMLYFMPVMTFIIGITLPGGLSLYWLLSTLFMLLQQWYFLRNHKARNTEHGT